jgi:hypothetical protein
MYQPGASTVNAGTMVCIREFRINARYPTWVQTIRTAAEMIAERGEPPRRTRRTLAVTSGLGSALCYALYDAALYYASTMLQEDLYQNMYMW